MCDKCDEMDMTIERYRTIAAQMPDAPTFDAIQKLVAELEAQKAALHPG